ncbi:metallophosphoesterase [Ruegeria sediminis]|uniref:Metallophosphoesterase n=1 Tax=Ruegeria sediminis TaxID=2583820 RepID=A0ABY2WVL6_9RHOB|nr:metallophosphoesterase [Ruegeria sediminis]TMV06351.1 metallophosphoesterase [Ruegeria sediminis]
MTRRGFIKGLLATFLAGLFVAAYGFLIEPALRLRVRRWSIRRDDWPSDKPVRIAVLTDLHAGEPYVTRARLRRIVARTNALGADLIVVLGDLTSSHGFATEPVLVKDTAAILGKLSAPLGVFAVLGNHDWWDDPAAQMRGAGPVETGTALEQNGIPVLENDALELPNGLWLAGLGDQLALRRSNGRLIGVDDLPGTMAKIPEDAPAILLAHEPDIFPKVPERVALTLSGHTHGGQVRCFGYSPVVPSKYGNRYAYGHVREKGRDLVVSGGIGCSILPVRFGVTPEITVVEMSA